jgi:hypothetical protein
VCCCGCAFLKWKSKSSRWFGKGATSSIVTADVDIPDKVLEKRIHLQQSASEEAEAFLLQGLSGHQEQGEQEQRGGRRRTARFWVCCWYLRSSSQGFLQGRVPQFARTVGDNEVVGPIPLSLDWEVLSVMVASVDQLKTWAPVRKSRKEDFLPILLKNGLLCWKSAA